MTDTEQKVEAFYAGAKAWRAELAALRRILSATPLEETFKWRSPCYTYAGANIATVWGLKEACVLSFFKGVLLKDPEGLLTAPGENSRSVRMAKFTRLADIRAAAPVLKAYVAEAIAAEKAGLKVEFRKDDLDYPEELVARLEADPAFDVAFHALTPGRRRGYVLHVSQAKQPSTRTARIEKHAARILAGKGLHDR